MNILPVVMAAMMVFTLHPIRAEDADADHWPAPADGPLYDDIHHFQAGMDPAYLTQGFGPSREHSLTLGAMAHSGPAMARPALRRSCS